jgi:hypothetical protein
LGERMKKMAAHSLEFGRKPRGRCQMACFGTNISRYRCWKPYWCVGGVAISEIPETMLVLSDGRPGEGIPFMLM